MAAIVTPRLILMPHSDDSVPLFTPPLFFSPPHQITRCRFPSTNLAAMTSEQTRVHVERGRKKMVQVGARVSVCVYVRVWGGGVKVDINDSSQMSLIHYCIVREML